MSFNASLVTAQHVAITPSDSTALSLFGFYVGVTGDVTALDSHGASALYKAVPAGAIIPVAVSKIMATGTTATNIVGFGPA